MRKTAVGTRECTTTEWKPLRRKEGENEEKSEAKTKSK